MRRGEDAAGAGDAAGVAPRLADGCAGFEEVAEGERKIGQRLVFAVAADGGQEVEEADGEGIFAADEVKQQAGADPHGDEDGQDPGDVAGHAALDALLEVDHAQEGEDERGEVENADRVEAGEDHAAPGGADLFVAGGEVLQDQGQAPGAGGGEEEGAVGLRQPVAGGADDLGDGGAGFDQPGQAVTIRARGGGGRAERLRQGHARAEQLGEGVVDDGEFIGGEGHGGRKRS